MALTTLEEVKAYLRVDADYEDALIGALTDSAKALCRDVARLSDEQWAAVDGEAEGGGPYTADELVTVRQTMKVAILYTAAYLFEHREKADHHALSLTLRSLLFAVREGVAL